MPTANRRASARLFCFSGDFIMCWIVLACFLAILAAPAAALAAYRYFFGKWPLRLNS
jgi:hypothetical protein